MAKMLFFVCKFIFFGIMGPMRNIIKKHSDFAMTDDDPTAITAFCIIRARPTKFPDDARYGIMATKRTLKHAVDRNRAKRLLRVWLRATEHKMKPDTDYVFIIRRAILDTSMNDGIDALKRAFRYLDKQ